MNYSETLVGAFTKLSLIVSAANLPLYVCCSFALFVMLRRSPGGPLAPALGRGRGRRRLLRLRLLRRRLGGVHLGAPAVARRRADLLLDARAPRVGADTRRLSREDAEAHIPRNRATRAGVPGDGLARAARQPAGQAGDAGAYSGDRARAPLPHRPQRRRACARAAAGTLALLLFEESPDEAQINPFFLSMIGSHRARRRARRSFDLLMSFQQLSEDWHADYETLEPRRRHDPARLRRLPGVRGARCSISPNSESHFVIWGPVVEGLPGHSVCCDNCARRAASRPSTS